MTKGTEWRAILFFSLPLMGSSLLQTLYSFVDSIIVGNFVSATAFGGIGMLNSSIMLLNFCATSLGTGASIVAAQYFGAERRRDLRETASTGMILSVIEGVILALICQLIAGWLIVDFLKTPDNMVAYSTWYFRIYGGGLIFQFLYNAAYGVLRAHGDSRGAMLFLLVAAILNVGLDLLFVVVFGWGVPGAAAATVIAQAGSALACTIYLWHFYPQYAFLKAENRIFRWTKAKKIYGIALPILCQQAILSIGFIVLQRLVNSFGEACIDGFAAMQKVESFIHIPSNALNTAISSFVGQNIGAGKYDRVKRGYRITALMGMGCCALIAVVLILNSQPLLGVFNIAADAMAVATEHLNILVVCMLFYSVSNITSGLLQGAGDVKITAVSSFANLIIRVGVSYIMAATWINYRCYYYSLPFAWFTAFAINFTRYKTGIWQKKRLVD